ncbi:MAG: hypothetical protein V1776_04370 [Candidatus Diapherotrites archaeon]
MFSSIRYTEFEYMNSFHTTPFCYFFIPLRKMTTLFFSGILSKIPLNPFWRLEEIL